jgi:hypothetical protein
MSLGMPSTECLNCHAALSGGRGLLVTATSLVVMWLAFMAAIVVALLI